MCARLDQGNLPQDCGGLQFVGFDFLFKADRAAKDGGSPMRDSGVLVPEKIRIKSQISAKFRSGRISTMGIDSAVKRYPAPLSVVRLLWSLRGWLWRACVECGSTKSQCPVA